MNTAHENFGGQEFLTTREAAKLPGISLRTVQLWAEDGVLVAWKTAGGHRRVTQTSIDKLLQQRVGSINAVISENPMTIVVVEDDSNMLELYELQFDYIESIFRTKADTFKIH